MCEIIASREFDRTSDAVQPLLKLFRRVGLGRAPYHSVGSYHSLFSSSTIRMLKKSAIFVLASFRPSTYRLRFSEGGRAGGGGSVRQDPLYGRTAPRSTGGTSSRFDSPAALPAERRVLARRGWAVEKSEL